MGLRERLAALAVRRAHVLLVELPGQWALRASVEREVISRGWALSDSPAASDVLVVCGVPGAEMRSLIDTVWDQLPGPRVRVSVTTTGDVGDCLDEATSQLVDTARHVRDARDRPGSSTPLPEGSDSQMGHGGTDHGDMDHGDMEHGGMDHGGTDHGDMENGDMDHGGMDHGDMEMSPGGIPLAQGGEDRDGLEMDVLHLTIGPVLRRWPAGLVLRCSLHGDVLADVEASLVDSGTRSPTEAAADVDAGAPPSGFAVAARHCDDVASLLGVAGWPDGESSARRVRDLLLGADRTSPDEVVTEVHHLEKQIRRSPGLRWSLRGLGRLSVERLAADGLPDHWRGDVHDRLLAKAALAREQAVRGHGAASGWPRWSLAQQAAVPLLLSGLDLATARLVVASLGLDTAASREPARHG